MGANTKIQWAHHTFNPWRGCTKVAAGCANCYAESQAKRNPGTLGVWGPDGSRVVAAEAMWRQPVKWNRDVETTVEIWKDDRPRVFCGSMCDVFDDWRGVVVDRNGNPIPCVDADEPGSARKLQRLSHVRLRLFDLIDQTDELTWLLLTKRIENARNMIPIKHGRRDAIKDGKANVEAWRRENVWLGVSIACQEDADRNVPELLKCRDLAAKLFLSIEPLVGPVDISRWLGPQSEGQWMNVVECGHRSSEYGINWVIVGGESGTNARPCDVAWIRSIVKQCRAAGVPVFVKQLGAVPECRCDEGGWQRAADGTCNDNSCRRVKLLDPKGGDPAEWTEDLRVREVPS